MCTGFFFLGEPGTTGGGQSQRTGGDKVIIFFFISTVQYSKKIVVRFTPERTFQIEVENFVLRNRKLHKVTIMDEGSTG